MSQQCPVQPGDWVLTEEGEHLYFRAYSITRHFGVFREQPHHPAPEFKLPLENLRKATALESCHA